MKTTVLVLLGSLLVFTTADSASASEDWPQWRYDAQRTNASANELPADYSMLWEKRFSPRTQAWDDPLNLDLMTFDKQFEPIVLDGKLYLTFNDECKLIDIFDLVVIRSAPN